MPGRCIAPCIKKANEALNYGNRNRELTSGSGEIKMSGGIPFSYSEFSDTPILLDIVLFCFAGKNPSETLLCFFYCALQSDDSNFTWDSDKKQNVALFQTWQKQKQPCPEPLQRSMHILQISFSILLSCSFQLPNHLAKPWVNTRNQCISTHNISHLNQSLQSRDSIILSSAHWESSLSLIFKEQG